MKVKITATFDVRTERERVTNTELARVLFLLLDEWDENYRREFFTEMAAHALSGVVNQAMRMITREDNSQNIDILDFEVDVT